MMSAVAPSGPVPFVCMWAPMSPRIFARTAVIRPSAVAPTVSSMICSRACVDATNDSRRSSIHLTASPQPQRRHRREHFLGVVVQLEPEPSAHLAA